MGDTGALVRRPVRTAGYRKDVAHPSATERVLDLLIALVNTRTRMSKEQIRTSVAGYHGDTAAFERTFERDKDLLRSMGIPLVVDRSPVHEDEFGYRIDLDAYRVPTESFTPEELGVLALASSLYQDTAWRSSAHRGVTKVRGLGPVADEAAPPLRLTLRAPGTEFDVLGEAIERRSRVRFDYEPLTSTRGPREVEPWRLVARSRNWYLLGRDVSRGAPRSFRLSRIRSAIELISEPDAFEAPSREDLDTALAGSAAEPVTVLVSLAPGKATLLRTRGTAVGEQDGRDLVELTAYEPSRLAEEISSYGPDAVVLAPAEVRSLVLARLRPLTELGAVGESHAG